MGVVPSSCPSLSFTELSHTRGTVLCFYPVTGRDWEENLRNTPGYLFSHLVDYAGTSTVIQAVQNVAICQKWTQAQPWPSSQWTWGSWEQLVLEIIVNLSRSGKIKDKHMHWCQNAYQRQENGLVGAALNNERFGGRNIGRNYLGGKFICPDTSPSNLFSMKPQLKKFLSHFQDSIQEGRLLFGYTGFL